MKVLAFVLLWVLPCMAQYRGFSATKVILGLSTENVLPKSARTYQIGNLTLPWKSAAVDSLYFTESGQTEGYITQASDLLKINDNSGIQFNIGGSTTYLELASNLLDVQKTLRLRDANPFRFGNGSGGDISLSWEVATDPDRFEMRRGSTQGVNMILSVDEGSNALIVHDNINPDRVLDNAFATIATTDTTSYTGATTDSRWTFCGYRQATATADIVIFVEPITDGVVVHRSAGTTSGAAYTVKLEKL